MIDPSDPPRLRDTADSMGLRELMQAAERDVGTDAQLARLSARLGAVLGPPAAVAAGASAAGLGGAAKLGLGAFALLVAGGGAWLLSTAQPVPPPVPPTSQPEAPVAAPAPPAPVAPLPQVEVAPELQPPEAEAPAPVPPPKAVAKPEAAAPSEAELLEQARSALKTDPARALARANQHAARFPGGALVQEREVIAIKALRQLGRASEADRRAEAFSKAFPGSAFARKLKPALESK
jgi:outer membrane biosynthesis protein TonB